MNLAVKYNAVQNIIYATGTKLVFKHISNLKNWKLQITTHIKRSVKY